MRTHWMRTLCTYCQAGLCCDVLCCAVSSHVFYQNTMIYIQCYWSIYGKIVHPIWVVCEFHGKNGTEQSLRDNSAPRNCIGSILFHSIWSVKWSLFNWNLLYHTTSFITKMYHLIFTIWIKSILWRILLSTM